MHVDSPLPPALHAYLGDFVARARRWAVVRSAGLAAAAFLGWMIAWCLVDRWAHLEAVPRAAALAAGGLIVVALVLRPLLALRRRADWIAAAAEVERNNPQLGQRLVTVTSRLLGSPQYRGSDEILRRLAREVDEQVRSVRAFPLRTAARAAASWTACAALGLLAVALCRVPDLGFRRLALRFLAPAAAVAPVTTTQLTVAPG